ncbi:LOW QUALITY PROTEIN: hypothetical protein RTBOTA2_002606, partial [Rhodotorula toruloides]
PPSPSAPGLPSSVPSNTPLVLAALFGCDGPATALPWFARAPSTWMGELGESGECDVLWRTVRSRGAVLLPMGALDLEVIQLGQQQQLARSQRRVSQLATPPNAARPRKSIHGLSVRGQTHGSRAWQSSRVGMQSSKDSVQPRRKAKDHCGGGGRVSVRAKPIARWYRSMSACVSASVPSHCADDVRTRKRAADSALRNMSAREKHNDGNTPRIDSLGIGPKISSGLIVCWSSSARARLGDCAHRGMAAFFASCASSSS